MADTSSNFASSLRFEYRRKFKVLLMKIGYACINTTLAEEKIQVNRTMVKKTFLSKGLSYASELALKNVQDLNKVIDWNMKHEIRLYRMSSDMFPWMSEYEFVDLQDIALIERVLRKIGQKAEENGMRLTFHPGPFNVLATTNDNVLMKTLKELRQHGEIMDMLGLPRTPYAKINIHVGGAFGDKQAAISRFVNNYQLLHDTARLRLTVENDDKANMFSVKDLMQIHELTGIPIVFDYLHHRFCTGGLTEKEALLLAVSTWPEGIRPVVHFSSAKKRFEDPAASEVSHADYIYQHIDRYDQDLDIMLEAKAKEKAIMKYRKEYRVSNR